MIILEKKYRVIFTGNEIVLGDYLQEQTGKTYPGEGYSYFECDTLEEMTDFIANNNLKYLEKDI
jgi:outer membrane lipoprotein-sorting protein